MRPSRPRHWRPDPVISEPLSGREGLHLLDRLPLGVVVFDAQQNVRYANPQHRDLLGRDIRELGMEAWLRAGCGDDACGEGIVHQWREYLWQKQLARVFSLKNGADHVREIEFQPRLLDDGDLLLTIRDVTDRHQAEDALNLTESKWQTVFRHVGTGIALIDPSGRFLDANPVFERLLGYSRGDLVRLGIADCVGLADIERLRMAERALAAGGSPVIGQGLVGDSTLLVRFRPREGDLFPARATLVPVTGPKGKPLWTALFVENGPGEDHAFEALAFRHLKEGVILTDLRGRIVDWNPAAAALFGLSPAEARGQGLARLYAAPGQEAEFNAELSRSLTERGRWEARCAYFRKDGSVGRAEVAFFAVVESGTPCSLVGIHREIGEESSSDDTRWRYQWTIASRLLVGEPGDAAAPPSLPLRMQARLRAAALLHELPGAEEGTLIALADYTRRLAGDLLQLTTEARSGAPARFKIRADESILADFETATLYGLLVTELVLAAMVLPTEEVVPQLSLSVFEGHPRLDLATISEATAGLAQGVLRLLAGDLRASLKLEHRDGRAQWVVRFPASR